MLPTKMAPPSIRSKELILNIKNEKEENVHLVLKTKN